MTNERYVARLACSVVLGAYDAGRIVGMIGFRREQGPKDNHKGLVWGFFVEPDYRQFGVGTALMAALIAEARKSVEQILLSVVEGNAAAAAFYERFGFKRYGLEPKALKSSTGYDNEILMVHFL